MTVQNDPVIRRRTDGTIDFAFYASRASSLRSEAILRFLFRLQSPSSQASTGATGRGQVTKAAR